MLSGIPSMLLFCLACLHTKNWFRFRIMIACAGVRAFGTAFEQGAFITSLGTKKQGHGRAASLTAHGTASRSFPAGSAR